MRNKCVACESGEGREQELETNGGGKIGDRRIDHAPGGILAELGAFSIG